MDNNLREAAETALGRLIEAVETVESLSPIEVHSSDEESRVHPEEAIEDSASDEEDNSFDRRMARDFERYRAQAAMRRRATIRFNRRGSTLSRRLISRHILFNEEERRRENIEERLFEADTAIAIRMSMATYKPQTKTVDKEDVDRICPVIKARHQIDKCTVCQEHVKRDEDIRILPCGHYMHDQCAVGWFTTGNAVCPVCRDKSFEERKQPIKKRKRVTI